MRSLPWTDGEGAEQAAAQQAGRAQQGPVQRFLRIRALGPLAFAAFSLQQISRPSQALSHQQHQQSSLSGHRLSLLGSPH